jgi:transposase InsO family protein
VLDQRARRAVAWRLGRRRDARLTRAVLDATVRRRRSPRDLIFHSDRRSEYSAGAFRDRPVALGIRQSSARRGPEDNAHMESFFHSLNAELVHGTRFTTDAALRRAVASYIRYYIHHRLHSALAYRSPVDYESSAA